MNTILLKVALVDLAGLVTNLRANGEEIDFSWPASPLSMLYLPMSSDLPTRRVISGSRKLNLGLISISPYYGTCACPSRGFCSFELALQSKIV